MYKSIQECTRVYRSVQECIDQQRNVASTSDMFILYRVLSSSASCGAIVLSQSRVNTKSCRSSDTRQVFHYVTSLKFNF